MTQEIVRELVDGVWVTRPKDQTGGGGSQPLGYLAQRVLTFAETPGAGTYTASLVLPAGAHVLEVVAFTIAGPWDADAAVLDTGDTAFPQGYFKAGDLVGQMVHAYDPPTSVGEADSWVDPQYGDWGGGIPDYVEICGWYSGKAVSGVFYPAGDTITATITTTGAGGATGRLRVDIIGFGVPVGDPIAATKT